MRTISNNEAKKRGCRYCLDRKSGCPYEECPYHELDTATSYESYYNEQAGLLDLRKLFSDL